MRSKIAAVLAATLLCVLVLVASAHAAFPGVNGRVAFQRNGEIYAVNANGTGVANLSNDNTPDTGESDPAWSPDGTHIAFVRQHADTGGGTYARNIWVMAADGTNQHNLTPNDPTATTRIDEEAPAWSPDGTKLAFIRRDNGNPFCCPYIAPSVDVWIMNADGTGQKNLTNTPPGPSESDPAWSPDGSKIAFSRFDDTRNIYTVNSDGTGDEHQLTDTGYNLDPNWSPDGSKIVFDANRGDNRLKLWVMNADGSDESQITDPQVPENQGDRKAAWSPAGDKIVFESTQGGLATINPDGTGRAPLNPAFPQPGQNFEPDWQPIPITAYPRPRGASPTRASLVPAYKRCSSPNNQHGSSLSYPSCTPPVQASDFVTLGSPPQEPANSIGSVTTTVASADVRIGVSITDVRDKTSLTDYTGELEGRLSLRITDKNSIGMPGGGAAAGTTEDAIFPFTVACDATSDPDTGSNCSVITSANVLVPGAVVAGQRAIWQLGQVQVFDGGSDGLASTSDDNTLFMAQGVFVP
jgi:Tol biopolymer transport system component